MLSHARCQCSTSSANQKYKQGVTLMPHKLTIDGGRIHLWRLTHTPRKHPRMISNCGLVKHPDFLRPATAQDRRCVHCFVGRRRR